MRVLALPSKRDNTKIWVGKKYAEKLQLTDGVFFINSISNSELPNWYNKATLLVFPSLSEGFGIPGLEAMNCNCPVVASNIPVFKEIYGDAAVYFNPNSIDDMALNSEFVILNFVFALICFLFED